MQALSIRTSRHWDLTAQPLTSFDKSCIVKNKVLEENVTKDFADLSL